MSTGKQPRRILQKMIHCCPLQYKGPQEPQLCWLAPAHLLCCTLETEPLSPHISSPVCQLMCSLRSRVYSWTMFITFAPFQTPGPTANEGGKCSQIKCKQSSCEQKPLFTKVQGKWLPLAQCHSLESSICVWLDKAPCRVQSQLLCVSLCATNF